MMPEDLENKLRSIFAQSAAGIVIPEQARTRLLRRDYHPRRVNLGPVTGLAAAAAATGIAVALAAGAGSPRNAAGPAIRLASHTFRLPAGYQLTAAAPCHPFAVTVQPPGGNGAHAHAQHPPDRQAMRAAASSAGGCIVLALTPPYTPTASAPDPYAYSTAHPVQIGSYHGFIWHARMFVFPGDKGRLQPGWHTATDLYVQLPAGTGTMRDLVIGATGLSDSALIKIAASGLSS